MLCDIAMANIDLLLECGFTKPVNITDEDKPDLNQTIALHKAILASLAEFTAFKQGLCVLGVGDVLKKLECLLQPFFCNDAVVELTSG